MAQTKKTVEKKPEEKKPEFKMEWEQITDTTFAMNVNGGVLISKGEALCFAPGVECFQGELI